MHAQPNTASEQQGQATVVAAWPVGVSVLAQAVNAFQRHDAHDACMDLPLRAHKAYALPPSFWAQAHIKRLKAS
jgi:hypothetical protein